MKAKMNASKSPVMKTQVVGSYPVPGWLQALPSAPNLQDAMLTIIKTQELAGLDIISDGELSRFDPNHPETNGMIEYFIRRQPVRRPIHHANGRGISGGFPRPYFLHQKPAIPGAHGYSLRNFDAREYVC